MLLLAGALLVYLGHCKGLFGALCARGFQQDLKLGDDERDGEAHDQHEREVKADFEPTYTASPRKMCTRSCSISTHQSSESTMRRGKWESRKDLGLLKLSRAAGLNSIHEPLPFSTFILPITGTIERFQGVGRRIRTDSGQLPGCWRTRRRRSLQFRHSVGRPTDQPAKVGCTLSQCAF